MRSLEAVGSADLGFLPVPLILGGAAAAGLVGGAGYGIWHKRQAQISHDECVRKAIDAGLNPDVVCVKPSVNLSLVGGDWKTTLLLVGGGALLVYLLLK